MIRFLAFAAALCLLSNIPVSAMFMRIDEPVPIDRLVANVERYIQERPDDADGHYTLGRIHSLAFAKAAWGGDDLQTVEVVPAEKRQRREGEPAPELPGFAAYQGVQVGEGQVRPPTLSSRAREHLAASLRHYRRAVELKPDHPLYMLGHAWMLEQAALYSKAVRQPEPAADEELGDLPATQPSWSEQALEGYRAAFKLAFDQDKARQHYLATPDALVSREAAEGIIRLLEGDGVAEAEQQEVKQMQVAIAELKQIPMAITPIVFAMEPGRRWGTLVDDTRRTRFDLAGDGVDREWPWLRGDVGILVWDPKRQGRIQSGRQLFGSATWWMFWETGYEALAALDDDGDGMLRGSELDGIRVWFDRNGDGRSGRGEVVSLASLGIVALGTQAESHSADDVAAWQRRGIELESGQTLSTWDWRPMSLPARSACRCQPVIAGGA